METTEIELIPLNSLESHEEKSKKMETSSLLGETSPSGPVDKNSDDNVKEEPLPSEGDRTPDDTWTPIESEDEGEPAEIPLPSVFVVLVGNPEGTGLCVFCEDLPCPPDPHLLCLHLRGQVRTVLLFCWWGWRDLPMGPPGSPLTCQLVRGRNQSSLRDTTRG